MKRITLDWDFKNKIKMFFYLRRILKVAKPKEIIIKPSSKKGYHIFLWVRNSFPTYKYKNYFGNDRHQTRLDKNHRYGRQTLFNKKRKFKRSKYKIE
jgi:hypothetical protein